MHQANAAEGQQLAEADAAPTATDIKVQQQHAVGQPQHRSGRIDREKRESRSGRGHGYEHERHKEHDKHRMEQEKHELTQELEKLTRDLSFQEMRT